jgi:hypothetical protein
MKSHEAWIAIAALALAGGFARAETVVQVPVDAVLDGRPVSTLTGGVVVPWTTGIDKDDAYMTTAAATSLHQTGPALPDDGRFAANADHPEVALHFSNAAPKTSPQAHLQTAMGAFSFAVPPATYREVELFLTSSYGDAPLVVTLTYADRSTTKATFTLPDWGTGKPLPTATPPRFFNLIAGLHKWNQAGASLDTPSHTITGVALATAADRVLASIEISKTTAAPWLTFWGATALATSVAAEAPDAAVDAGDAGDAPASNDAPEAHDAGAADAIPTDRASAAADAADASDAGPTGASPPEASNFDAPAASPGRVDAAAPSASVPPSSGCAVADARGDQAFGLALLTLGVTLARRGPKRDRRRAKRDPSDQYPSLCTRPTSSPSSAAQRWIH